MRDDKRDDPFGEFFREFERMIEEMFDVPGSVRFETAADVGTPSHIDVYEDDDGIRVVADLPGVEKADIEVTCDGRIVSIAADGERRSYDEQVRLPRRVDESSAAASYNNGVLEIRFDTVRDGHAIDID